MLRNRLLVLSIAIFLIVATLIVLPTMIPSSSFCSNSIAAQGDDSCLAEKATISALQVKLQQVSFQATLDTINNQATLTAVSDMVGFDYPATIVALESEVEALESSAGGEIPPTPVPGLPFVEDFDDNSQGWDLTGGVTISNAELTLLEWDTAAIVPIKSADEFYIEVDVRTSHFGYARPYIGFGDVSGRNWHQILFISNSIQLNSVSGDNISTIFSFDYRPQNAFTLSITYTGGQLEFYVDGSLVTISQLTSKGNEIILGKDSVYASGGVIYFDNLVIQAPH